MRQKYFLCISGNLIYLTIVYIFPRNCFSNKWRVTPINPTPTITAVPVRTNNHTSNKKDILNISTYLRKPQQQ